MAGARVALSFASDEGHGSDTFRFGEDEPIPHPSELCEELKLGAAWFFADGYAWAMHAEHEGWETADVFEESNNVE